MAQQIANLLRENTRETDIWANVSGAAEKSLSVSNSINFLLDFDNPEIFLKVCEATSEFVSPLA